MWGDQHRDGQPSDRKSRRRPSRDPPDHVTIAVKDRVRETAPAGSRLSSRSAFPHSAQLASAEVMRLSPHFWALVSDVRRTGIERELRQKTMPAPARTVRSCRFSPTPKSKSALLPLACLPAR